MSAVRLITTNDIPGCMRLKEAASWNQLERDWQNVMRMAPEGCFGVECDGRIVATATAVAYGHDLAWIGMVLTHPDYRRRGLARLLMQEALYHLDGLGVDWIKLDATDMGRPLYATLGFEDECAIERWVREPAPCDGPELPPCTEIPYALDREAFGADRAKLLDMLAAIESAAGAEGGYAMGRTGSDAAYFGPCVSRSAREARELLRWYVRRHADQTIYWDVLPDNAAASSLAREFGFAPLRYLTRMARRGSAAAPAFRHDRCLQFGIAGFEYG